jgi:pilus assembly protein CpaB
MNRSRLFMIGGLALVLGLLVSYPVYNRLRTSGGGNEPGVEVVVAVNDLQVGAKLEDRDIRLTRFPQSVVPPGAFTKKSQVVGRGVVLPVSRGEFILPGKLAAANAGSGLPSLIPPGMRAVSVRVNDVVSVAGFVQPGSRVDVLATGNQGNDRQTTTVLENVAVIAVGKNLERNPTGDAAPAPVITLLVSPDDGQRLTLASQEGRIQLALRNPLDTRREQIGATRSSSLYPGAVQPVSSQTKPRAHKTTIPVTVIPPSGYAVETIRGSKRDETKF